MVAKEQMIWGAGASPDGRLPVQCTARSSGLDLSKPFQIAGRKYGPLPGMARGYFKGRQPDMGAVQGK